jgi:hypothetical protein
LNWAETPSETCQWVRGVEWLSTGVIHRAGSFHVKPRVNRGEGLWMTVENELSVRWWEAADTRSSMPVPTGDDIGPALR